jgi:hypothetical protein
VKVQLVIRKTAMLLPANFRNELSLLEEEKSSDVLLTRVLVFYESYEDSLKPWEGSFDGTLVFEWMSLYVCL